MKEKRRKVLKTISRVSFSIIVVLAILGAINIFTFSKNGVLHDSLYTQKIDSTYAVYAMPIPEETDFAGERMPLENFDVRESLDLEILKVSYWHSELFLYLKRAKRFFPDIERILKENGIPDDFKYLAVAESGLVNAVSPAGAKGYWQFLESTAKSYDLTVNKEVDERYHFEKSTKAACRFLKDAYQKYGNWTMAAASYNVGQGNIDKQITKQKQKSYYDLLLNKETSRYIFRTVAIKLIMSDPHKYGFRFREKDLYPKIPVYEIEVDSTISNITAFAIKHNTNYKILKYLNPWLRKNTLTNTSKKKYKIKIPQKNARINTHADVLDKKDTL